MPFLMVVGASGDLCSARVEVPTARIMGEGRREKAQEIFSLLIAATVVSGLVLRRYQYSVYRRSPLSGAKEDAGGSHPVATIILVALPFLMLQYAFGSLSVTARSRSWG